MSGVIANDISVTVTPVYDAVNSYPSENHFVFKYYITIKNLTKSPIQVLKRRWYIHDFSKGITEVAGNGVIGLTPVILPNEEFKYFSNVVLNSEVGTMNGFYILADLSNNNTFEVEIPKFALVSKTLSN